MKRLLPLFVLPLAACSSSSSDPRRFSAIDTSPVASIAEASPVDAGGLLRLSADAGQILQLRERQTSNGFHQDMVLAYAKEGNPENRIEIDVITRPGQKGVGKPTEAGIRSEILSRFSNVPMKIVLQPKQNGLGTFGLAVGARGDGARCIYAWQWVEDIKDAASNRSSLSKMMARSTAASIRVSMCRRDVTLDALAMQVESLSIANDADLDRLLAVNGTAPVNAHTGNPGDAAVDLPSSLESLIGPSRRPVVVAKAEKPNPPRHVKRTATSSESVKQKAPEEQAPPVQPTYGVADGGPRYMAPVGSATAPAYRSTPYASTGPAVSVQSSLDPSLPPQAYRGPNSGPGSR